LTARVIPLPTAMVPSVVSDASATPVDEYGGPVMVPNLAAPLAFGSEQPRSGSASRPAFAGMSEVRPTSGSPPRPAIPVFATAGAQVRARTSSGSPPPFHGNLWNGYLRSGREEQPRFERDSQRNRSLEGRPGSRKHKRYTRSVEIMGSLRKAMAKCGEDPNITEAEALELQHEVEWRPSVFYRLMEHEGANGALEALEAAEGAAPRAPRPARQLDAAQLAADRERRVRRVFADSWQFLQGNDSARELLAKLETVALRAFGPGEEAKDEAIAMLWMLDWDGAALETKFGAPPASEMAIGGLDPTFRKVAHQLARSLGLHSESRVVDGPRGAQENKVIALRPPRSQTRGGDGEAWVAPYSVAQVLARM